MSLKVPLLTAMTLLAFAGCKKYEEPRTAPEREPAVSAAPNAGAPAVTADKDVQTGDKDVIIGTAVIGAGKDTKLTVDLTDADPGVYTAALHAAGDCKKIDDDDVPVPVQVLGEIRVPDGSEKAHVEMVLDQEKLRAAGFKTPQARVVVRESEDNDKDLTDGDIVACREVALGMFGS